MKFLKPASTFLLAGFLIVGLSACAEGTETDDGLETDTAMTDTMGTEGQMMDAEPVSLQSTISTLEGGIMSLPISAAVQNIDGWQRRLQNANQQGAQEIATTLGSLKSQLQGKQPSQINGQEVSRLLTQLSQQTNNAAQNLSGQQQQQLQSLGQMLSEASNQLSSGAGMAGEGGIEDGE